MNFIVVICPNIGYYNQKLTNAINFLCQVQIFKDINVKIKNKSIYSMVYRRLIL